MSRTLRSGRIAANANVPTTTYTYDANGNLAQAGGWSYVWDYLNRMLASGYNNSTTTYAYDPSGARVLQTSTTSTTYYPNKYYSLTSTTAGSNTYATSTNYIWNGDILLATIDQRLYNGAATGSAIYRYIHPDHLGSTNAVTDQNGSLVQLMDYYPYGATRIATSTYPTNEKRQYIGQFSDAQTSLNYLNARFYDGQRGQFLSEDPVFWGTPKAQDLSDPQTLNTYNYSNDNPTLKVIQVVNLVPPLYLS
jgi:RHS repeat-associated protein